MFEFHDITTRFWQDIASRPSGPFAFRFILQPVMALIFATRDGIKDARLDRVPYFWRILSQHGQRGETLMEGLRAVSRVILLSIVMETIYQIWQLKAFYPGELIFVTFLLAFLPY